MIKRSQGRKRQIMGKERKKDNECSDVFMILDVVKERKDDVSGCFYNQNKSRS